MTNITAVDISGLSKAEVLAALFNATSPAGMGFLQAANGPQVMDVAYAERLIDAGNTATPDYGGINMPGRPELYFDYLYGRPLKLDLSDSSFNPSGFDRDNGGDGTAQRIIDRLRASHDVNPTESAETSQKLLAERREAFPNEALLGDLIAQGKAITKKVTDCIREEGITIPPNLRSRDYLNWASDTALRFYDRERGQFACEMFLYLVGQNDDTRWIAADEFTPMLLLIGLDEGRDRLEYMMKGFAA